MKRNYYAMAIDLGASGGRMLLAEYDGRNLTCRDSYYMENSFADWNGRLYWDVLRLYQEMIRGFCYYYKKGYPIDSVGISTWGVDLVLLDRDGLPVGFPRCYRDPVNRTAFQKVSEIIPEREFYEMTGILPDPINSVYQLYAASEESRWEAVDSFLFIPDFFTYMMTGSLGTEPSVASTSQMLDRQTQEFHGGICERLGLEGLHFPEILRGPMVRGCFTRNLTEQIGYGRVKVMNTNSHDTGSAMYMARAIPRTELLMNSGTYAIISAVRDTPLIDEESYRCGITNELLLDGGVRPAINLSGLYLINQCRERWRLEGRNYSWMEITGLAAGAKPFLGRIDIMAPELQGGGNMPFLIQQQCRRRGIHIPQNDGEVARMVYESMAEEFAERIRQYEKAAGMTYRCLNIVGGGAKNNFLNQLIADASGKYVHPGTAEATAYGNILSQLEGTGELTREDSVEVMRETFADCLIEPQRKG